MPSTHLRQNVLVHARRVVVKMGTQLLTGPGGKLDQAFLGRIAAQIAALRERKFEVTVVSSGAIGAGCAELELKERPKDVADLQAVAAVGQRRLMTHLHEAFEPHGLKVGQLLLTRSDFDDRVRFLNLRNCVNRLHVMGCVPVVNENDTVAVEEIRFGDNDLLAALMANAVQAEALVIFSVVDGLLDGHGKRIDLVESMAEATSHDRKDKSKLGSGGMTTKLEAARIVTESGHIAVVANGREPDALLKIFSGAPIGTVFAPAARRLDGRERWIGLTKRPHGTLSIDDGAVAALCARGKSLLPSGVTAIDGRFDRGEVVRVCDSAGKEIARGLTNYSSEEIAQVMGKKSSQIEKVLGRAAYAEAIHRDNLVLTAADPSGRNPQSSHPA
ncbi:MAG: glutamate 5-kinase [Planctomycetota bacterium]|nr:glutamate 5-kinase [Planctomycetota bacterium]